MQDNNKNTFEIKSAFIDTQSNILIGENILGVLPQKIAKLCPLTNKIMIVADFRKM